MSEIHFTAAALRNVAQVSVMHPKPVADAVAGAFGGGIHPLAAVVLRKHETKAHPDLHRALDRAEADGYLVVVVTHQRFTLGMRELLAAEQ